MKRWILASAALFGGGSASAVFAAQGGSPDGPDVAVVALQGAAAPAELRRVESVRATPGVDNTCDPAGLCLRVTVSTDLTPSACGDQVALDVTAGDQVNFCYTVTNNSDGAFEYQTASDNAGRAERQFFLAFKHTIEPHATYQFNRIQTMRETQRATTTWTGTASAPEYQYDDTAPFDWIEIAGDGTDLDIGDIAQTSVEMPFPVNFYGIPSRYLAVSGSSIAFGAMRSDYIVPWGWELPVSCGIAYAAVCPMIAPFGMGWFAEQYGGGIYSRTMGAAPNRRFVVQWNEVPVWSNAGGVSLGGVTYEIVFEEGSDELLFQYRDTRFDDPADLDKDDGGAAVVGLNFGGVPAQAVATAYSQYAPSLRDGLAIRWTPSAVTTSRATAAATVNVSAPALGLSAERIDVAITSQGSATSSLILENRTYSSILRWSFGIPDSAAHLPDGPRAQAAGQAVELSLSEIPRLLRARADENARQAAAGSSLRFPLPQRRSATSRTSPVAPLGSTSVPAYVVMEAFDFESDWIDKQQLARWDLAAPQTVALVNDVFTSQSILAGTFLLDFAGDDFTTLYTMNGPDLMAFNTSSGTGVPIARFDLTNQIYTRSFNYLASERVFYSLMCREHRFNCRLHKLDPNEGTVEQGAYLASDIYVVTLAMAATGEMYAANLAPGGQLVAIDRVTGNTRVVGDMHVLNDAPVLVGWYMDFDDRTGILYLAAYDQNTGESVVHTVDTVTGLATEVGRYAWETTGMSAAAIGGLAIATVAPFGSCTDLAAVPWLRVEPASGEITHGHAEVRFSFDAGDLADGVYTANLCLNSNDPERRHVVIPATLTVGGTEAIFRDGFD